MDIYKKFLEKGWKPNWNLHPSPNETLLEMVIVEPRQHENLPYILANVSHMLPYAALTIVHSNHNKDLVRSIVPEGTNIRLLNILPDNLTLAAYSGLLISARFWKMLVSPKILIFQTDTGIRKNNILDFIHTDYIGAPWRVNWGEPNCKPCYVGNGGFSLRNRKAMIELCEHHSEVPFLGPEDIYFARQLSKQDRYITASVKEAQSFSVESIYYPDPFGFHQPWNIHPRWMLEELFNVDISSKPIPVIDRVEIKDENNNPIYLDIASHKLLYQWICLGIGPKGLQISDKALFPIRTVKGTINLTISMSSGEVNSLVFHV